MSTPPVIAKVQELLTDTGHLGPVVASCPALFAVGMSSAAYSLSKQIMGHNLSLREKVDRAKTLKQVMRGFRAAGEAVLDGSLGLNWKRVLQALSIFVRNKSHTSLVSLVSVLDEEKPWRSMFLKYREMRNLTRRLSDYLPHGAALQLGNGTAQLQDEVDRLEADVALEQGRVVQARAQLFAKEDELKALRDDLERAVRTGQTWREAYNRLAVRVRNQTASQVSQSAMAVPTPVTLPNRGSPTKRTLAATVGRSPIGTVAKQGKVDPLSAVPISRPVSSTAMPVVAVPASTARPLNTVSSVSLIRPVSSVLPPPSVPVASAPSRLPPTVSRPPVAIAPTVSRAVAVVQQTPHLVTSSAAPHVIKVPDVPRLAVTTVPPDMSAQSVMPPPPRHSAAISASLQLVPCSTQLSASPLGNSTSGRVLVSGSSLHAASTPPSVVTLPSVRCSVPKLALPQSTRSVPVVSSAFNSISAQGPQVSSLQSPMSKPVLPQSVPQPPTPTLPSVSSAASSKASSLPVQHTATPVVGRPVMTVNTTPLPVSASQLRVVSSTPSVVDSVPSSGTPAPPAVCRPVIDLPVLHVTTVPSSLTSRLAAPASSFVANLLTVSSGAPVANAAADQQQQQSRLQQQHGGTAMNASRGAVRGGVSGQGQGGQSASGAVNGDGEEDSERSVRERKNRKRLGAGSDSENEDDEPPKKKTKDQAKTTSTTTSDGSAEVDLAGGTQQGVTPILSTVAVSEDGEVDCEMPDDLPLDTTQDEEAEKEKEKAKDDADKSAPAPAPRRNRSRGQADEETSAAQEAAILKALEEEEDDE